MGFYGWQECAAGKATGPEFLRPYGN
jgi:hypothetical protein